MPLSRRVLAVALTVPSLAIGQSPTITIRAGIVLDGRGGVARNTTIVVAGSRIVRLDPALTAATYDLSRLTVMPGGIDTHVHLTSHFDPNGRAHNDPGGTEPLQQTVLYAEENAYRALMAGITTVQSIGSTLDRDLRDAIARGTIPGPRVITSLDWITPEDGDADGLRRTVQQRVAGGADLIKILGSKSIREGGGPTLSEEQLRAACGEAKAHGRRAVVHAHAAEAARRAAGPRGVQSRPATTQPARRLRHRRRGGRFRQELGGADLPGAGGGTTAHGCDRVRNVPSSPVPPDGGHDRRDRPGARGRLDRRRRQPGGGHHRAAASRVRDEGRNRSEERRAPGAVKIPTPEADPATARR